MSPREKTLAEVVNLLTRTGIAVQSSKIYNGIKGCYDYGPIGVEVKRNIANKWWTDVVHKNPNVVGFESSILTHKKVLEASQHLSNFSDYKSNCLITNRPFGVDKAQPLAVSPKNELVITTESALEAKDWQAALAKKIHPNLLIQRKGCQLFLFLHADVNASSKTLSLKTTDSQQAWISTPYHGFACPRTNSPFVSSPEKFNLMFRTSNSTINTVDSLVSLVQSHLSSGGDVAGLKGLLTDQLSRDSLYLRPETAQGIFSQFGLFATTLGMKLPFGVAQTGKSFRNEIAPDHFIFRTSEFEQMEVEFFTEPDQAEHWYTHWIQSRLAWWRSLANEPADFSLCVAEPADLAHYSSGCTDIVYRFPWGQDEIEGIAKRGDYDLKQHQAHSGSSLKATLSSGTGSMLPHVVEPSAGLTRGLFALLCDAYTKETKTDASGNASKPRVFLKLHPSIAPYKVAVLPIVKNKPDITNKALEVYQTILNTDLFCRYDAEGSVGKRYAKHDEIGTPFAVTIDDNTLSQNTVTVRDRDSATQDTVLVQDLISYLTAKIHRQ